MRYCLFKWHTLWGVSGPPDPLIPPPNSIFKETALARPIGYRTGAHGGGNFTRGANRKGNRNGRKPLYPPGTPLSAMSIKLTDSQRALCLTLGHGGVSKGMRLALDIAARVMPLWAQDQSTVYELLKHRVFGKEQAKQLTAEALGRLHRALSEHWEDSAREDPLPPSLKYPPGSI